MVSGRAAKVATVLAVFRLFWVLVIACGAVRNEFSCPFGARVAIIDFLIA